MGLLPPHEMQNCIYFLGFPPHAAILAKLTALLQDSLPSGGFHGK
jgi:hypothetical protein